VCIFPRSSGDVMPVICSSTKFLQPDRPPPLRPRKFRSLSERERESAPSYPGHTDNTYTHHRAFRRQVERARRLARVSATASVLCSNYEYTPLCACNRCATAALAPAPELVPAPAEEGEPSAFGANVGEGGGS
jgi:hypothetical protein